MKSSTRINSLFSQSKAIQ